LLSHSTDITVLQFTKIILVQDIPLCVKYSNKGKGKGHPRTGHEDPEGE